MSTGKCRNLPAALGLIVNYGPRRSAPDSALAGAVVSPRTIFTSSLDSAAIYAFADATSVSGSAERPVT
jgi:hypothetical protein